MVESRGGDRGNSVQVIVDMKRVNLLIQSMVYQDHLNRNSQAERERVFCRHGFEHMLAVARIAYIYCLERGLVAPEGSLPETGSPDIGAPFPAQVSKEVVYAAGLLHDIGRWVEYETGEDHAQASARLAEPLLCECGFSEPEKALILESIRRHRQKTGVLDKQEDPGTHPLVVALALADLWSRDCLHCAARLECHKQDLISSWSLVL